MSKEFVPIRTKTITPNTELLFDIYIQIQDRYIHYIHQGDDIDQTRLTNLQRKKLKQFFIDAQDEVKYQVFLDRTLASVITSKSLAPEQKAETIINISNSSVKEVYENPDKKEAFKQLEKAAFGILAVIGKNSDILRKFYPLLENSNADPIYLHAISTASIASCMCEYLEMNERQQNDICLASMLLDIGRTRMQPDAQKIFEIPYETLTEQQLELYRGHPNLGAEILSEKEYISSIITNLVQSHEERKDGSGPLAKRQLEQAEEVIGICSAFDQMRTLQGLPITDALDNLEKKYRSQFNPELVSNLKNVLRKQGISLA